MNELVEKGQGIELSVIELHHQNSEAKNSIKNVVYKARIMMVHADLRWPEFMEKDLWPMNLIHAVYLHNYTPKKYSGLSPEYLWTGTKSSQIKYNNAHDWGCSVYVLDPRLQYEQNLPK